MVTDVVGVAAGTNVLGWDTRRLQGGGVSVTVVAKRVELGRQHDRRRQPGEVGCTHGREAGIASVGRVDVVVEEPANQRRRQEVTVGALGERSARHVAVG